MCCWWLSCPRMLPCAQQAADQLRLVASAHASLLTGAAASPAICRAGGDRCGRRVWPHCGGYHGVGACCRAEWLGQHERVRLASSLQGCWCCVVALPGSCCCRGAIAPASSSGCHAAITPDPLPTATRRTRRPRAWMPPKALPDSWCAAAPSPCKQLSGRHDPRARGCRRHCQRGGSRGQAPAGARTRLLAWLLPG